MAKAKHILQLSPEERQLFLNSFDFVISDCDGKELDNNNK